MRISWKKFRSEIGYTCKKSHIHAVALCTNAIASVHDFPRKTTIGGHMETTYAIQKVRCSSRNSYFFDDWRLNGNQA